MQKTILFVTLFQLTGTLLSSQTDEYTYQNDFSDEKNTFSAYSNKDGKVWIKDGKFQMQYHIEGAWMKAETIYYNTKEDFTVETAVHTLSSSEGRYSGLLFGQKNSNNSNCFAVDNNGNFCVFYYENGVYKQLKDWTSSDAVKNGSVYNSLKVRRQGAVYFFLVNDVEVFRSDKIKLFGPCLGFLVYGKAIVEADYLNVKQKRKKINLIENHEKFGEKEDLGPEINSNVHELTPVLSPDGLHLYMSRVNHPKNVGGKGYDIWVSDFKDGKWGPAKNVGAPLNNSNTNFVLGVSADNTTLLLGSTYEDTDPGAPVDGFSISNKKEKGWSNPKHLNIKNYVNKNAYKEACISADSKTIIFGLESDFTYGEKDLYVSFRSGDKTWSEPVNLGPVINTFADDFSPMLAPDGKTLYFSSYGHPGYGNADIFVSKRLDDTWKNWSIPQNLGPKFNTAGWDGYFTVSAQGDYAFISSVKAGKEDADLFRVKIPQTAAPEATFLLHGKVINDKTKTPLSSEIKLMESSTGKIIQSIESKQETGEYSIIVHKTGKYDIASYHKGFISIHKTIEVPEIKEYKEMKLDLALTPIEAGQTIILKNIFFTPNKYDLLPESDEELNKLVKVMKDNPEMKIQVSGHTSRNSEGEKFNEELSTNRALSVKNYLIQHGIEEARVIYKGFGFAKPIFKDEDEEHQAQNRRVEFTIISK